ncbi:hypothetical protein DL96DRAFT_1702479 [Flagelloscypha sp. PMI_526]|nr:hypothetical protein DL96DRAFT_1702479 [Flagelloscypha sp. PMI_526]
MAKSPITCHILDSSLGRPAEGVQIRLQSFYPASEPNGAEMFLPLAEGVTNADGRCLDLLPPRGSEEAKVEDAELKPGTYKIVFKTKPYFEATGRESFYPWVEVSFTITNPAEHYHIPLLISPFAFTTYRGS